MTHSPQRNEVEDRRVPTHICLFASYTCLIFGYRIPKRASQTRFVVSIHTTVVAAARVTGLRTRIRSALLDIAIICNDFCSTHGWVPTPVSEAESSGVPRVARVAVGGASRAVPRSRRATCLIMRYRHIALDKYRRIVRPPPRRPRHARPRPAAALCDGGVGGPRTCLGLLWVSLQPVSHLGFASAAAAGHRRFPLFQLTEANFSAGREGRRLVWRRLVWRLEV